MQKNDELGLFTDSLTKDEVNFSKKVYKKLKNNANWTDLFNDERIKKATNIKEYPNRSPNEIKEIKAALFEVRIAHAIHQLHLTADYEHNAFNDSNSTIDFKLNCNPIWLIELTSLREGEAVKEATCKYGDYFIYESRTKPGSNAPEVIDIIRAQRALCSKVSDKNGTPIKFPPPMSDQYHMIIMDMRSFNAGSSDCYDFINIAYGRKCLVSVQDGVYCSSWIEKNKEKPIKGLFDRDHPEAATRLIREKIHALGFISEQDYQDCEILDELKIFPNPLLFDSKDQFHSILPDALKKNIIWCG